MILETLPSVSRLSPTEKLLLVNEIWDDLESNPKELPVSMELVAELERRMEIYYRDPTQATTWEAIQRRILGKTFDEE